MKKIIVALVLAFSIIGTSFANTSKDEATLFKAIVLSKAKIEQNYAEGKKYNKIIASFFVELRTTKNYSKINELDEKLTKLISNYKNKNYLSREDEKIYNVILNIYYRNKLLKDYVFKWQVNNSNIISNIIWDNTNKTNENSKTNNSTASEIISKTDKIANESTTVTNSLRYSYSIPRAWSEKKYDNWDISLTNNDSVNKSNVSFVTTNLKNSSLSSFTNDLKNEILKNNSVRNLSESYETIDWKSANKISYNLIEWEYKNIYIVEYNWVALVITTTENSQIISNNISDIIRSIKIYK